VNRANIDNLCMCSEAQLYSITSLFCGRCGRRIVSSENTEKEQEIVHEVTEGNPDRLSHGAVLIAAGEAEPDILPDCRITKREFVKTLRDLGIGIFLGLLAEPAKTLITRRSGAIDTDQEAREEASQRVRSLVLTEDDIRNAENTLLKEGVIILREQAKQYRHERQYAMSMLFDALADHAIGIQSKDAENDLNKLLYANPYPAVKSRLYFHRGRTRVFCGNTEEGLNDLDAAIGHAPKKDAKSRVEFLRQAMSHAYISIERANVLEPNKWTRISSKIREACDIVGLQNISIDDFSERQKRAVAFDPILGTGILIFEALMRAAEYRGDLKNCQRALEWHYNLIRTLEQNHPILGWIRYTPLAAQAIALGELEFAEKVLDRAHNIAMSTNTADPVVRYARSQQENKGVEWLFHEVVFASLYLAKHDPIRAKAHLEDPLEPNNHTKCLTFARAAKLYEMETFPIDDIRQRIDASVGASHVSARTHWTYLPNIPNFQKLTYGL
jgi:hypothetical protein